MKNIFILCGAILIITFTNNLANAQEAQPNDACTAGQEGYYKRSSMLTSTQGGNMLFCNGSNWVGLINYTSAGNIGIGDFSSVTTDDALHLLSGVFRVDGGAGNQAGCIQFNDTTDKLQFSNDCSTFADLDAIGSSSNVFEVTGAAGSEVVSSVNANAPYTASDFVFGSPSLDDDADAGHDKRMFFDKSKGAFRAGSADADEWDDANVGTGSVSFGVNNTVRSSNSFASGDNNTLYTGDNSAIFGINNYMEASYSMAVGYGNDVRSFYTLGVGYSNSVNGHAAIALGYDNNATGDHAKVIGSLSTAAAANSMVFGRNVTVSNTGAYSFAFGLGHAAGTTPIVSGVSSYGIFMGDQSAMDITAANTFALLGGSMIINPNAPTDTTVTPRATLDLGAATDAILLPAGLDGERPTGVNGMIRYNATSAEFEGYENGAWVSMGANGGTGATEINGLSDGFTDYTIDHNVIIGRTSATALTTGAQYNTFIGENAGATAANSTAATDQNTAVGYSALSSNTTGHNNTALGSSTLAANTSGEHNVALGFQAGDLNTTGSDNILIGYDVDAPVATTSNHLNIGGTIYGDLANDAIGIGQVPDSGVELDVLGDIEYTGTITDMSDRRLKKDIVEITVGQLQNIIDLKGVTFKMKNDPKGSLEYGFIAQEVQAIYPDLVYERSDTMLSLNYVGLIAPMVEAIEEQNSEIKELKARLNVFEAYIKGHKTIH